MGSPSSEKKRPQFVKLSLFAFFGHFKEAQSSHISLFVFKTVPHSVCACDMLISCALAPFGAMMSLPGAPKGPKTALLFSLEGLQLLKVHAVGPKLHKWVIFNGHYHCFALRHGFGPFKRCPGPKGPLLAPITKIRSPKILAQTA